MNRFTTRVDANWQIRWTHRWERADLLAALFVLFGFFNAARSLAHGEYAGLGWLLSVLIGVTLFTASGLERAPVGASAGVKKPEGSVRPRRWASRAFTRVVEFGSRLDTRLIGPHEPEDD